MPAGFALWAVIAAGAGCGSDPQSVHLELLTPVPDQVLTLADDTNDGRDGLQFRVTGTSSGIGQGTTINLFVAGEQRAQSSEIDAAGEIDFGEVTLPPGEHPIHIATSSASSSSDQEQQYTFKALLIRDPAPRAMLSAREDEDQSKRDLQISVRVEAFAIGSEDVTLVLDDAALEDAITPDSERIAAFAGITLNEGPHTLVAQTGSGADLVASPAITVEVTEASCAGIAFVAPEVPPGADRVSLGGPNDCPSGSAPFSADFRVATDEGDGRTARLLVNGEPAGEAMVEDATLRFDAVQLPVGDSPITVTVEVQNSDGQSCEVDFPVELLVDCAGPRCDLESPVPFAYRDANGDSTLYLNAAMQDGSNAFDIEVGTDTDLAGSDVQLVIDGGSGSALSAEARRQGDATLAVFDRVALADGEHTIEAFCTDASGNVGSSGELTWVVDTKACGLDVSDPVEGALFVPDDDEDVASTGTQVVVTSAVTGDDCVAQRARVCDPGVGITAGDFIAYGGASPLLSTLRLDDAFGQSLCVEVQDRAGNNTRGSVNVKYRRNAPALRIESPSDGARYSVAGGGSVLADVNGNTTACDASFTIACTLGAAVELRAGSRTGTVIATGDCAAPAAPAPALPMGYDGRALIVAPFDQGTGTGTVVATQTITGNSTKTLVGASDPVTLAGDCDPPVPALVGDPCELADDGFLVVAQDTDLVTRDVTVRLSEAELATLQLTVDNSDGTAATISSPDGSAVGNHLFGGVPFGGVGTVTITASVLDAAGNTGRSECTAQITADPPGLTLTQPVMNQQLVPRVTESETCDTGTAGEYGVRLIGTLEQAQDRTASIYVNGVLVASNVALVGTALDTCVPVPDDAVNDPAGPSTITARIATTRTGQAYVERSRSVSVRTVEITDPLEGDDLVATEDCGTGPDSGYRVYADVDVSHLGKGFTLSSGLGAPAQGSVAAASVSGCVLIEAGPQIITASIAGTPASDSVTVNGL